LHLWKWWVVEELSNMCRGTGWAVKWFFSWSWCARRNRPKGARNILVSRPRPSLLLWPTSFIHRAY
jgi:hypothetical protein